VNTTEPNALREVVEVEGWMGKFLSSINLPGKPSLNTNFSSSPFSIPTSKSTTRELREACPLQLLVFQVLFSLSRRPSDLLLSDSTVN